MDDLISDLTEAELRKLLTDLWVNQWLVTRAAVKAWRAEYKPLPDSSRPAPSKLYKPPHGGYPDA